MISRELAGLPWQSFNIGSSLWHKCTYYQYLTIRLNNPIVYSTGIAQRVYRTIMECSKYIQQFKKKL